MAIIALIGVSECYLRRKTDPLKQLKRTHPEVAAFRYYPTFLPNIGPTSWPHWRIKEKKYTRGLTAAGGVARRCDRHGHELAGESPAIALERREYVDKGKGARRNSFDLPEEG